MPACLGGVVAADTAIGAVDGDRSASCAPAELDSIIEMVGRVDASMLSKLRAVLSTAAAPLGLNPVIDVDDLARRAQTLRLAALVPSVLAALHRAATRRAGPNRNSEPSLRWAQCSLRISV